MLDVHGLRFEVCGWPAVADEVVRDFLWFETADGAPADVTVELEQGAPRWDGYGDLAAAFVTPRNVVYQNGSRTILDYFGRASAELDRAAGRIVIRSEHPHLAHEAAYLFLLSRIGEHLDACGLPRLHALGLAGPRGAICVLLPSGGGKSTLAVSALADERAKLLAEDTPLLDARGYVHPFPLRIGVNPTDAERMPAGSVRRIERMEFHDKLVLDLDGFRDRVEGEAAADGRPGRRAAARWDARAGSSGCRAARRPARCCARASSASASTRGWSSSCSAACATWRARPARRSRALVAAPPPRAARGSGG